MSEQSEVLANGSLVYKSATSEGGSVTVTYDVQNDVLSNTIGQVGAIPINLLLGTPGAIGRRPTNETAKELFDVAKALPLKGDLDIHIGHSSIWNEIKRTMQTDIKGRPNLFLRSLFLPFSVLDAASSKLTRSDYYNPLTHAAYIFHPNKYIGMHEIGHGQMFDALKRPGLVVAARVGLQLLSGLAGVPGIAGVAGQVGLGLGMEMIASQNVLNMIKDQTKKQKALHVLLPAFGTYVGDAFVQGRNVLVPGYIPTSLKNATLYYGAVLAGHIVARAPDVYNRIRQIFAPRAQVQPALAVA